MCVDGQVPRAVGARGFGTLVSRGVSGAGVPVLDSKVSSQPLQGVRSCFSKMWAAVTPTDQAFPGLRRAAAEVGEVQGGPPRSTI